jgi:hypothetical protein
MRTLRRMRQKLFVPALAIVVALFQALSVSAAQVEVAEPLIRFAPTESRLHEMCGAGRFDACTLFVAFALRVDCVNDSSAVRMRAAARVTPWILVFNMKKAPHEMEHIHDVAQDLARYVGDLERVEFVSTARA